MVPPNSQYCGRRCLLAGVVNCGGGGDLVGDEESYLLLEGGSRRRSRRRPWEGGHLTSRPWLWFVYGIGSVG